MTASLRMMARLRPISTKEIDRIRDAQPTGLSGSGKARSRTASRSIASQEANPSASRILVLGARAEAVRLCQLSLCTEPIIQVIPI
jgi:hypothetical protein